MITPKLSIGCDKSDTNSPCGQIMVRCGYTTPKGERGPAMGPTIGPAMRPAPRIVQLGTILAEDHPLHPPLVAG